MKHLILIISLLAILVWFGTNVCADIYMHNPRGSNNRNCERAQNRQNANRLFDSQNNDKGGYACPRPQGSENEIEKSTDSRLGGDKRMYYYEGSILPIQWASQHSCGDDRALCQVIIQYSCESGMRDGLPTIYDPANPNSVESSAKGTVPDDEEGSKSNLYGIHETYDYYQSCKSRQRNKGLWVADQKVKREQAIGTRQNPGGSRYGFECPEERDYYPYWHPTQWRDIVVFTGNTSYCEMYLSESENVKGRGECRETRVDATGKETEVKSTFNNLEACIGADSSKDREGRTIRTSWITQSSHGIDPPECLLTDSISSRDNHLGNAGETTGIFSDMATYNWTVPSLPSGVESLDRCVIRIRYNISTADIVPFNGTDSGDNSDASPMIQDQYVDVGMGVDLEMAINTDQTGRTFQDRSYTFKIAKRPEKITIGSTEVPLRKDAQIYNVNVRGKRGNIVQTYPAVEYDFVPNILFLNGGDFVHFQWTGSDYNPNRAPNNAEGGPPQRTSSTDMSPANNDNSGADRSNLVQAESLGVTIPRNAERAYFFKSPPYGEVNTEWVKKLAFLDQDLSKCQTTKALKINEVNKGSEANAQRDVLNCGKISGQKHPYFDAGLFQVATNGRHKFISTRNNNFSNRQQKMVINVKKGMWNTANSLQSSIWLHLSIILSILFLIL